METENTRNILQNALNKAISYQEYRDLIDRLMEAGKTTGSNHNENMLHYTELNVARMNKWDKRFRLEPDVEQLLREWEQPEIWLVITEGWCGDAAHAIPVLEKMAQISDQIELKLVMRDEHLKLMDLFLTNGSRSIPKLIRLNPESLEVISTWGPRPEELTHIFQRMREEDIEPAEVKKEMQLWYAKNRGKAIESELAALLAEEVQK